MTVYADEVFFLNAMIDYLLLSVAELLSDGRKAPWRKLLGAAFGGAYAVLAAAVPQTNTVLINLTAFCALGVLAYGVTRAAFRRALLFLLVSCGFGGTVLLTAIVLRLPVQMRFGLPYYKVDPRLLCLLAGALYGAVRLLLLRFCRCPGQLVCAQIALNGSVAAVTALCDTGNTLKDPLTAEPVLIADLKTAQLLLPQLGLTAQQLLQPADLMRKLMIFHPETRPRLLPFRTVGESGLLLAIRCDSIRIDGRLTVNHTVAFSPSAFSAEDPYQALTGGNYVFQLSKKAAPAAGTAARRIRALYRRQRHPASAAHGCRGADDAAANGRRRRNSKIAADRTKPAAGGIHCKTV